MTRSISKLSIWLGNPKIKFHFLSWKSIKFFVTFILLLFGSENYKGKELNLKTNQKSNRKTLSLNEF